jgi:hypothetical protein
MCLLAVLRLVRTSPAGGERDRGCALLQQACINLSLALACQGMLALCLMQVRACVCDAQRVDDFGLAPGYTTCSNTQCHAQVTSMRLAC